MARVLNLSLICALLVTISSCNLSPARADSPDDGTIVGDLLDDGKEAAYSAATDGSKVTLSGSELHQDPDSRPSRPSTAIPRKPAPLTGRQVQALLDEACYGDGECGTRDPGTLNPLILSEEAEPAEPGEPGRAVTIEDVARFLPARGVLHGEPSGWAVVGVPANFWVEVEPMTVTGELLGDVAQVRFTPTLYTFDYGDGTTRTSAEPGSSWRDLGQDELSATPTGHVFRERGDRPVKVTIAYTAEYRVDGGAWIGVAGAVSAAAPVVDTLVVAERTVLTAGAAR